MKGYLPIIVKYSPIRKLAIIPFEKSPDTIYRGFELQYIDGEPYGVGYRVLAYRNDNYVDVYDDVALNFNENEKYVFTQIRPGITGNWQVYDRVQATWESGDRKKYIMYYLKHRSLLFDFKLFLLTIPSCIKFSLENLQTSKGSK